MTTQDPERRQEAARRALWESPYGTYERVEAVDKAIDVLDWEEIERILDVKDQGA